MPFVPLQPLATVEKFGPVWRTITERLRAFYSPQGKKLEPRPKRREESEDVSCRVTRSVVPQPAEWLSCIDSTFQSK